MTQIDVYLKRHWEELQNYSEQEAYIPIGDTSSIEYLFSVSSEMRYVYGKIIVNINDIEFINETCELDSFFSTIDTSREEIYSGRIVNIDNSHFSLNFLYKENTLYLKYMENTVVLPSREFSKAFREAAGQYYSLFIKYGNKNQEDYKFFLEELERWDM